MLVDSSSSDCFIDMNFVNKHSLSIYPVPLLKLYLFDRTTNNTLTQAITLSSCFETSDITDIFLCHFTGWLLFPCLWTQLAYLQQSID